MGIGLHATAAQAIRWAKGPAIAVFAALALALAANAWAQEPLPPDRLPPVSGSLLGSNAPSDMLRFVAPGTAGAGRADESATIRLGQFSGGSQLTVVQPTPLPVMRPENLPPTTNVASSAVTALPSSLP